MKKHYFIFVLSLLLSACVDQKALLRQFTPKDDDALARKFIESIHKGDLAAAQQMLEPGFGTGDALTGLQSLHEVLDQGDPVSYEVIGCDVKYFSGATRTNLSYQIQFPKAWVIGHVLIMEKSGVKHVTGSHFQPVADSLEVLNRFTLKGKSLAHYLFLAACLGVPVFILTTLVICARTPIRRKPLWILFILIGFFSFRMDWTSGVVSFQPVSFMLLGSSVFCASPYASWVFGCAVPLGAIIFLIRRRKLMMVPVAPEVVVANQPQSP